MESRAIKFIFGIDATLLSKLHLYDFTSYIQKHSNYHIVPVDGSPNVFTGDMVCSSESEAGHHIRRLIIDGLSAISYPYTTHYFIMFNDMHPLSGCISSVKDIVNE